jgi:hypothetical protein
MIAEKDIFEVVKYFKSIYPIINIKDKVFITNDKSGYAEFYYTVDQFYMMHGRLYKNKDSNIFLDWIGNKDFIIDLKSMSKIKESLKKNIISADIDESTFRINYTDKDGSAQSFVCSTTDSIDSEFKSVVEKINLLNKELGSDIELDKSVFSDEITEIYMAEGSTSSSQEKVFELPSKRILSLIKNANKHIMRISGELPNGKKLIEISSENDFVRLSEIFAII